MQSELLKGKRVAIVHDWLVVYAGAERVLEQMISCLPDADLFALVDFLPTNDRAFIHNKAVTTSFIQKLPFAKTKYRNYLPLMPLAIEQFDLSAYDVIISSSHAVAKGVLIGPDQLHLCMCYSPIRYAWDLQFQYLRESRLESGIRGWSARLLLHRIRLWDTRTANSVDNFIAISRFVARRIEKAYRRQSEVIYPPVDVSSFVFRPDKENFYLAASRMVPYKNLPLIIEAFASMPEKRLVVIGDGPDLGKCKSVAASNVTIMGWQPFSVLRDHMQRAKAFVFAAEEDFGITPLEAQACGTPVIGFAKGGLLETIRGLGKERPTGVFFAEQSCAAIQAAVREFERENSKIVAEDCRDNVMRFSPEEFKEAFTKFVDAKYTAVNSQLD